MSNDNKGQITIIDVNLPTEAEKENLIDIAKENLIKIAEQGNRALDELNDIATQTQHPLAYQALSSLIKALNDTNSRIVEVSQKENEIKNPAEKNIVNNNLFLTTEQLLEKMLNKKETE